MKSNSIILSFFYRKWVVYAKKPFKSPETVVEYFGRYTHKVAISNHRLVEVDQLSVSFKYNESFGNVVQQASISSTLPHDIEA